ncbi:MAG: CoA transferase [Oscillibacter sp.]|nr:CoA transferase [Oscillibacter sp.]
MLHGIKVLSFTHYLQGPSCVQILADLGADVVKIEPHKGAFERGWSGCDAYKNGVSVFFMLGNRNQRSFTVDLKSSEGKRVIYDLVKEYDVVVENYRAGVMGKLGFSYERLRQINPGLVYCSCSGYGDSGPYFKKPGQDLLAQSLSGLAALNGPGGSPPVPLGSTVVDQHGAVLAALGIITALFDRERTGKGHKVDACLLNAALDLQTEPLGYYLNGGRLTPRTDSGLATRFHESPYGIYSTKDTYITLSLNSQEKLEKVFEPGALSRFSKRDQSSGRLEFDRVVAEQMRKRTTEEWIELFEANDIWYAPVHEYEDVLKDPQVQHNQVFLKMQHPVAGEVTVLNHPNRYDGKAPELRRLPPDLGSGTQEVLREIGYRQEEIDRLLREKVITDGGKE